MKRHSESEIENKLRVAEELVAQGQSQAQISQNIGVSVMTLHRWRKRRELSASDRRFNGAATPVSSEKNNEVRGLVAQYGDSRPLLGEQNVSVENLILENRRLKKIVTDLLLEKMKLEEMSEAREAGFQKLAANLQAE